VRRPVAVTETGMGYHGGGDEAIEVEAPVRHDDPVTLRIDTADAVQRHGFKTPEEILCGQELLLLHFKIDTRSDVNICRV
jgi:hypothetical protein